MKTTSAFMAVCTALLMFSCSGDDENVKISITYEGVTYSRANTTLGNLALGGRTSVSLQGNEVEMTFEVVGIKKYGDVSLSGYYKGAVTVIE